MMETAVEEISACQREAAATVERTEFPRKDVGLQPSLRQPRSESPVGGVGIRLLRLAAERSFVVCDEHPPQRENGAATVKTRADEESATVVRTAVASHSAEQEVRTESAENPGENRRALPRRESGSRVIVHRIGAEEPVRREWMDWLLHSARLQGQLCDISMSSIAFLLPEAAQVGERIMLRLISPCVRDHIDTIGTVIRANILTAGGTKIVCRLEKRLTFTQVRSLGRQLSGRTLM